MKQKIKSTVFYTLILLFTVSAVGFILTNPVFKDALRLDGEKFVIFGKVYVINDGAARAVENIIGFNKVLFGSFIYNAVRDFAVTVTRFLKSCEVICFELLRQIYG